MQVLDDFTIRDGYVRCKGAILKQMMWAVIIAGGMSIAVYSILTGYILKEDIGLGRWVLFIIILGVVCIGWVIGVYGVYGSLPDFTARKVFVGQTIVKDKHLRESRGMHYYIAYLKPNGEKSDLKSVSKKVYDHLEIDDEVFVYMGDYTQQFLKVEKA
ncbi:MAG: hypothetical protein GY810_05405 [Aureispira sp.]|nr:hypothetical protein [Aureispira sp.]